MTSCDVTSKIRGAHVWHPVTWRAISARPYLADARARAEGLLAHIKGGTGAYSESKGVAYIRQMVADGIERRDGHVCDPNDLWLTDGASVACHYLMKTLIRDENDAVGPARDCSPTAERLTLRVRVKRWDVRVMRREIRVKWRCVGSRGPGGYR